MCIEKSKLMLSMVDRISHIHCHRKKSWPINKFLIFLFHRITFKSHFGWIRWLMLGPKCQTGMFQVQVQGGRVMLTFRLGGKVGLMKTHFLPSIRINQQRPKVFHQSWFNQWNQSKWHNFFCSTSWQVLDGFDWHYHASVHFCLTNAIDKSQQHCKKFLRMSKIEPGATGWEARMLPLCNEATQLKFKSRILGLGPVRY